MTGSVASSLFTLMTARDCFRERSFKGELALRHNHIRRRPVNVLRWLSIATVVRVLLHPTAYQQIGGKNLEGKRAGGIIKII